MQRALLLPVLLMAIGCDLRDPTPVDPTKVVSSEFRALGPLATSYYVAVNGDSTKSGLDSLHPWPLPYAFRGAGGRLHGGDNVTILAGKYLGRFVASVNGTSNSSPIVFRAKGRSILYDTTIVRPDTSILTVRGQYLEFWDLEIADSALEQPRIHTRPDLVWNYGSHNKYIGLVLHDGEIGFLNESSSGGLAVDVEIVGCISYNNGRQQPDTGGIGHGFYIKGEGNDWVGVRYTVAFNNYGYGIHAYTELGHGLSKLTFEGNVGFNNGSVSTDRFGVIELDPNFLLGGKVIASQDSVRNQRGYFSPELPQNSQNVEVGWEGSTQPNQDVWVTGSRITGGNPALEIRDWNSATVTNSLLLSNATKIVSLEDTTHNGFTWGNNTYYRDSSATAWYYKGNKTFHDWKAAIAPLASSDIVPDPPLLAPYWSVGAEQLHTRYGNIPGRGIIVVWKWADNFPLYFNISNIAAVGDSVEIRFAQDLFGTPAWAGRYAGGNVYLAMCMCPTHPATPLGGAVVPPNTDGKFQVYLVKVVK